MHVAARGKLCYPPTTLLSNATGKSESTSPIASEPFGEGQIRPVNQFLSATGAAWLIITRVSPQTACPIGGGAARASGGKGVNWAIHRGTTTIATDRSNSAAAIECRANAQTCFASAP